jgi:hypothetical protein
VNGNGNQKIVGMLPLIINVVTLMVGFAVAAALTRAELANLTDRVEEVRVSLTASVTENRLNLQQANRERNENIRELGRLEERTRLMLEGWRLMPTNQSQSKGQ